MKKIIISKMIKVFLLIICFNFYFFINQLNAQVNSYIPFPDSNVVWGTSWNYFVGPSENWNYEYSKYWYLLTGDTIINSTDTKKSVKYRKLECIIDEHAIGLPYFLPVEGGYIGAIRQDIESRKVYILPADSTKEILLYNFDLNIGDTIDGYYSDILAKQTYDYLDSIYYQYHGIVIGIDSVSDHNNKWRKRFKCHRKKIGGIGYSEFHIIEGIGSSDGLLESGPFEAKKGQKYAAYGYGRLDCFSEDEVVVYKGKYWNSNYCGIPNNVNNSILEINKVEIYPNPVINSDYFFVDISKQDEFELKIFDVSGKELSVNYDKVSNNKIRIKTNNIKSGIYMLFIKSDNRLYRTKKILIMDN